MTDNEIIKTLECCLNCECSNCPCRTEDGHCIGVDEDLILDLINRKKAEIERLKEITESSLVKKLIPTWKAQAIREFANIVIKRVQGIPQHHFCFLSVEESINDLVKEMAEVE